MIIFEQLLFGLAIGSMYALVASGLALIWGTMRILNFAHGEFYMLGGFFMFFFTVTMSMPPIISIILTAIFVFMVGVLFKVTVIQRLLNQPDWQISTIVATLGLSIFLQNLALVLWGERYKNIPYYIDQTFSFGGVNIAGQRLLIIFTSAIVIALLYFLIKYTRLGMAIRATAQNGDASKLMGVSVKVIYMCVFGLSSALAALAAVMIAPIDSVNPWMGLTPALKAFIVVVLGGLGSLPGAIIGGLMLGIVESFSVSILSSEWKDIVGFALLILILWIKPTGLFGAKE